MKNSLHLSFLFLIATTNLLLAQNGTFTKVIYGLEPIEASSFIPTVDHHYIIAGGIQKGLLIKIDSTGEILWNKTYRSLNTDIHFNQIIPTSDSCFLAIGKILIYSTNQLNGLILKVRSNGEIVWSKEIVFKDFNISLQNITRTLDNGYIFTGKAEHQNLPYTSIVVVKMDANGHIEWSSRLVAGNTFNSAHSIKQTPDSLFLIIGSITNCSPCIESPYLLKLTQSGTPIWSNQYNRMSGIPQQGYDAYCDKEGIISLFTSSIMKTDYSGNLIWTNYYSPLTLSCSYDCYSPKLHKISSGDFIFSSRGYFGSNLAKLDSLGNILWMKNLIIKAVDAIETETNGSVILGNGPLIGVLQRSRVLIPHIGIIKADSLGDSKNCVYQANFNKENDSTIVTMIQFQIAQGEGKEDSIFISHDSLNLGSYEGCVEVSSTNQNNNYLDIKLSPNPSMNKVVIDSNDGVTMSRLSIYNCNSILCYQQQLNASRIELDISKFPVGLYFLKIQSGFETKIFKFTKI